MKFTEKEKAALSAYALGEQLEKGLLDEAVVVEEIRWSDMDINFLVIGAQRILTVEEDGRDSWEFEVVVCSGYNIMTRTYMEEYIFDRLDEAFGLERLLDFGDKMTVGCFAT